VATSTKGEQEKLIDTLRSWQNVEDRSAISASEVIESSDNELLRQVMEIIRADSMRHHAVQQFIIDSFTSRAPSLTPEELADVWGRIEEHIELERKMIRSVEASLDAVGGKKMLVQEYLLRYLLADEQKHDNLLTDLDTLKRGMYPYGS
jgi:hypothetical protein